MSSLPEPATESGLSTAQAKSRLARFGPNVVEETPVPAWRAFLGKFWAPVPWLLEAAIALQILLGADLEAGIIALLLAFNTTLGFLQESRAGAALAALRQRLAPTALVLRDGAWGRLPAARLVPGDIVRLALGAIVPADTGIVSGAVLLDQSMLTGESVPVEAGPGATAHAGSIVRRGLATARVTATGRNTAYGKAAELVHIAHAASTEQAEVFAVTRGLASINGTLAVLLVMVAGLVLHLPGPALVQLALTALLATIPVALPAAFALSGAISARRLGESGVLLTRLSAAHEAAAMDVLCSDKTGTLTRNLMEVTAVDPLPGVTVDRVLSLAALATAEGEPDPIDAAIRAIGSHLPAAPEQRLRFIPFDPESKTSAAVILIDGQEQEIRLGAFEIIGKIAASPADARQRVDVLAAAGRRVLAVAMGPVNALRLVGLLALSDPPRDDAGRLIADLDRLGVRTVMVTGDSAVTAAAVAQQVGIAGDVCRTTVTAGMSDVERYGVFARVVPAGKFELVRLLQAGGHGVGMCGDGTNDAAALRQAQVGIAVSSATDAAKAAAAMVLTEPGLGGVVLAVREGRTGMRTLLTYTLNMLAKKIEIVLFLLCGLALTGHAILTPALMVLMLLTNDFLSMAITTDRPPPDALPSRWRVRRVVLVAAILGVGKLAFTVALLLTGLHAFHLGAGAAQTLALLALVFSSQSLLYVVREEAPLWHSRPGHWLLAATLADVGLMSALAMTGTLMTALAWPVVLLALAAAAVMALVLDRVKRPLLAMLKAD